MYVIIIIIQLNYFPFFSSGSSGITFRNSATYLLQKLNTFQKIMESCEDYLTADITGTLGSIS